MKKLLFIFALMLTYVGSTYAYTYEANISTSSGFKSYWANNVNSSMVTYFISAKGVLLQRMTGYGKVEAYNQVDKYMGSKSIRSSTDEFKAETAQLLPNQIIGKVKLSAMGEKYSQNTRIYSYGQAGIRW